VAVTKALLPATILLADHCSADREMAQAIFEQAGHRVVIAEDGEQAVELVTAIRPQLVVIETEMPRLGGVEAGRQLKANTAGYIPVLLVSSHNQAQDRVDGLRGGADDYLGKPYNPQELLARAEVLLRIQASFQRASRPSSRGRRALTPGGNIEGPHIAVSPRAFRRRVEELFARATRESDPLACLRVAIDPVAGEPGAEPATHEDCEQNLRNQLQTLRTVIRSSVRGADRYNPDGEQGYLVVLSDTHFPGALTVAERIVRQLRRHLRAHAEPLFTVSIGVSFYPNRETRKVEDLLSLVDAALDRARAEGGGRICLYQHQGYLYAPE